MSHSWPRYMFLKTLACLSRSVEAYPHPIRATPGSRYTYRSRDGRRDIAVHMYKSSTAVMPSPVLLNWHSSGHIMPLHGQDDLFCRHVAHPTDYTVLHASYGLAPEHPFSAPLEDVEDLILSVLDRSDLYNLRNLSICGFSAGATLALAAASNAHSKIPRDAIRSMIAFYPPTNLALDPAAKVPPELPAETLHPLVLRLFAACYVPAGVAASDARISSGLADPATFPDDMLIITRARDALAPEGEDLVQKLASHGKRVIHRRMAGVGQSWDKHVVESTMGARKRDEVYELAAQFLKDMQR